MVNFQPKEQGRIIGKKGGKRHEEGAHPEQGQP